jgi:transposase
MLSGGARPVGLPHQRCAPVMRSDPAMATLVDELVPDQLWAMVEPLLPVPPRPHGDRRRAIPDRNCFAAIVYMARTSTPWRLLPAQGLGCGSASTCWRRLTEWANGACLTSSICSIWRSWIGWVHRAGWTGRGPVWTP